MDYMTKTKQTEAENNVKDAGAVFPQMRIVC